MPESKQSNPKGIGSNDLVEKTGKGKSKKPNKVKGESKFAKNQEDQEVLLKMPGGLEYKMPGKRQRVVIGSIVIGLNVLLVLAVILYFYSPAFQDFIFNVGRD